jgi:hypothetical protein
MNDMNYINDCGASKVYLNIYLLEPVGLHIFKTFFYCTIIGHKKMHPICAAVRGGAGGHMEGARDGARHANRRKGNVYMCLFGDIRNSVHEKSHGIP